MVALKEPKSEGNHFLNELSTRILWDYLKDISKKFADISIKWVCKQWYTATSPTQKLNERLLLANIWWTSSLTLSHIKIIVVSTFEPANYALRRFMCKLAH